jgi:universal stress protein E
MAAVDPVHAHDKPASLDEEILDFADMICEAISGKLMLFHARTPWEDAVRLNPELRNIQAAPRNDPYGEYCGRIETQVLELAVRHNVPRQRVQIVEGYAAEALPRIAEQQAASIVILGAASRSWLHRALVGHTAERVLDALNCDVLVVKPPGFRGPVSRQSRHHVERSAARPTPL